MADFTEADIHKRAERILEMMTWQGFAALQRRVGELKLPPDAAREVVEGMAMDQLLAGQELTVLPSWYERKHYKKEYLSLLQILGMY